VRERMTVLAFAMAWVAVVWGAAAGAQALPEPQQLQEALDDVGYAELLGAAQLSDEQLIALQDLQAQAQMDAAVSPELAAVLTKLLAAVLSGMSVEEARQSLGEGQQILQQAQQRRQQSLQAATAQLLQRLTAEQQDALVWFSSPAHALDGAVGMVAQARAVPDPQWQQFRQQASQALASMASQMGMGNGASAEQVAALLDAARALDEATFQAQRPTLAREWLPKLMPALAQRLQDPQFRQQQLTQACQHLIAYPRASALVQARLDATPAP